MEIREAAGTGGAATTASPLTVGVDELQYPVTAGKPVTYVVRVANTGTAAESQVVVTVVAPPGVAVNRLQTFGPAKYDLEGQTVLFKPVPEIGPGQSVTFRVQVLTSQAGEVRVARRPPAASIRKRRPGKKRPRCCPKSPSQAEAVGI